jgi:hypothetical protein
VASKYTSSRMANLSDRQLEIISTIAIQRKDCHITELVRFFGVTHMAVSSSLSNLLRDGYISEVAKEKGKAKPLRLTDKGVAAAVVYCGCKFEVIGLLHEYRLSDAKIIDILIKTIKNGNLREKIYRQCLELLLNYNLFDEKGNGILGIGADFLPIDESKRALIEAVGDTNYKLLDVDRRRFFQAMWLLGIMELLAQANVFDTPYFKGLVKAVAPLLREMGMPSQALYAKT